MSERYEKIRIKKGAAHSVLVEVEKGDVSFGCTLTAHEASLLARDLIRASMSTTPDAPRIEPAPSTAAENSEIAALRRDMQQFVRDLSDRVKAIETGAASRPAMGPPPGLSIATRNADRHRLDGAIAPGVEQSSPGLRTRYETGLDP